MCKHRNLQCEALDPYQNYSNRVVFAFKEGSHGFFICSSSSSHDSGLSSDMSTNYILATAESGRDSMESPINIPTGIVGMTLGSLLLAGAGIGLLRVMLVVSWTATGVTTWLCVLRVVRGTEEGGAEWLTTGVSRVYLQNKGILFVQFMQ